MFTGARVLKTGLAVAISMYICNVFDIQPAIFAGAATVLNLQPSLGLTLNTAREQLLVQFISISIAIFLGLVLGSHPIVMGLATILVIHICVRNKWRGGISGGIMAAIFILASPPAQFLDHALIRSLAIFIGVSVALLVNMTIAPPRYRQPLQQKLAELNTEVGAYFYEAVQSFLHLNIPSPEDMEARQKRIEKLFQESQRLYELYRLDLGPNIEKQNKQEKDNKFFNDYLVYNKGLWQRTRDVLFLAQERQERRREAGNQPISNEFQEILELLGNALVLFKQNNEELQAKLLDKAHRQLEEPHIWSKLDSILNRWHDRFPSGSYHLHALIEVALVTYKIRWAAKESARLLGTEHSA